MEKKKYIKPSIKAISTAPMRFICTSPKKGVTSVESSAGLTYGGKGSGPARSRDLGWDDEDW